MEKRKDNFIIGEFIIRNSEREITEYQRKAIKEQLGEQAEKDLEGSKTCMVTRIEHNTGVWAVEYPSYCKMFHCINAFAHDDEKELGTLETFLKLLMEDAVTIGDNDYYAEKEEIKRHLVERQTSK